MLEGAQFSLNVLAFWSFRGPIGLGLARENPLRFIILHTLLSPKLIMLDLVFCGSAQTPDAIDVCVAASEKPKPDGH
jgi:hypothetical protein